ncbi:MAG: hypothetical protein CMN76_19680 [Spirochaetaceae bacterium]|nr:hypothetical protein [Spirochaetaceae bacterium]|tara:strand:+ start:20421 stop:22220 length:1800 start_codon:yes stop_codon:yes gene_type:complete
MSLEQSLIKNIISAFLPPWTERVGIPPSRPELAALFPERTSPIPLDLAPSSSLDGIYLDGEDAARDSRQLTGQLETLAPGGIAVLFLSRKHWTVKGLRQACEGTGFRILFYSSVSPGQKIAFTKEGLPVPASWIKRIFRAGKLATFPALSFYGGQGLFVILQKKFSQSPSSRSGISVVMLMPEDRTAAAKMLIRWDSFLKEKRFDEVQLVYVEDSRLDPPPLELEADAVRKVDHYRPTGPYGALRSGLAFSRGRKVIVDFSRGSVDPSMSLPLLDRFIQEEKNMGKRHFVVQAVDYRMRNPYGWLKGLVLRFVAGTVYPDSPIRVYPAWTASLLADLHPEEVKKHPLSVSMIVKRNGGKFINQKLNVSGVKNALKLSIPSMLFSYLRMRTGKLLGYILISALALSTFPFLEQSMASARFHLSHTDMSLGWILAGSALLMRANRSLDLKTGSATSAFHRYLQNRIPHWEQSLNHAKEAVTTSRLLRGLLLTLQSLLVSGLFYAGSALLVFRRPGYGAWILIVYLLHFFLALLILGPGPFPLFAGTEYWENGAVELSRLIQLAWEGRFVEYALAPSQLGFLATLELITALVVIRLFRRKHF